MIFFFLNLKAEGHVLPNHHIGNTVGLDEHPYISFKVCVKPNAANIGGVNIFGEKYGDHPQGICMRAVY